MNEAAVIESLKKVGLLQGLSFLPDSDEAFLSLAKVMRPRKFEAGQTLLKEGEKGDEFFILIQGQVSVYKSTPDGDSYKVVILDGKIAPTFGEGGLIESEARSATIQCDQDSVCLVLTQSDFQKFCEQKPQWAVPILRKVALNLMGNLRKTSHDLVLLHRALMNEVRT